MRQYFGRSAIVCALTFAGLQSAQAQSPCIQSYQQTSSNAAVLRDALRDVHNGRRDLLGALCAYEEEMIKYGFAAVRASLAQMERLHTQSLTKRFATKVLFRILDLSPALRKRVLDLGG
jgi:2-polyprenyl-6-methoxyphenol hydroxylase-like FAD-dependent oxidoreductase